MINRAGPLRLAACLTLAAVTFAGLTLATARADEHDGHPSREQQHRWDHHYDRRPDVYYSAPPVVIAPRGYYEQPSTNLTFILPFFR